MTLCSCGRTIKTKKAKRCSKCKALPYKKVLDAIIKKRMSMPRHRVVQYQERRPEE